VGIAFLAVAAHFFPVRTIAEQTIGVDSDPMSASDSALNQESIEKLQLLEDCIREYYYEPETATVETLENGMYKGLMDSLGDPYTVYYTPEEYNSMTEETSGVYKGIGAYIGLDTKTGAPVFTGIMPGTPAEKAGLMVGDIICEVDGTDTLSMDTSEVANLVKGEEGTTVTIKVSRDGEYVTVTATRETINVPTVTSEMLDNQIGYLKISQFDDVTPGQFDEEYSKLKAAGMKSMILDLRDNPGGTVTAVTQIASEMLPEGLIFYMEDKNGEREEYTCPGADFNIPMVVLVNGYSASASEILAGAIQDAGIGTLVGTQTYGKGIVQNLYPLGDGSAIKITIADYYTRNGRNIHKVGIEPDQVLEFDKDLYEKDKTDNQLEKAKEILLSK
jgi:carboxyl-terminal processing protease